MRLSSLCAVFLAGLTMGAPAFADIANPEDTSQASEEEGDTGKEEESGCASVGTEASIFMALFPVAGLGLLALYRRKP